MVASREELLWTELKTILKTDTDLSYIKQVFEGWRETTTQDAFPCIYLEPATATEAGPGYA